MAEEYASAFADDLDHLELDRTVLDEAASLAVTGLPMLDIGCGPGHVGAYIAARGVTVIGLDLAPRVLAVARRRNPALPVAAADMRRLPLAAAACGGAVAFYSLQYVPRDDIVAALTEMRRVLAPGAVLVVATHLGDGVLHVPTTWFGHDVAAIGNTMHNEPELIAALDTAGFTLRRVRRRANLPHEAPTERIYLTAVAGAVPA